MWLEFFLSRIFERPDPEAAPTIETCAMQERRVEVLALGRMLGGVTDIQIETEKQLLLRMRFKCTGILNDVSSARDYVRNFEGAVKQFDTSPSLAKNAEKETKTSDLNSKFADLAETAVQLTQQLVRVQEISQRVIQRQDTNMRIMGHQLHTHINRMEVRFAQDVYGVYVHVQLCHHAHRKEQAKLVRNSKAAARSAQQVLKRMIQLFAIAQDESRIQANELESRFVENTQLAAKMLEDRMITRAVDMRNQIVEDLQYEVHETNVQINKKLQTMEHRIVEDTHKDAFDIAASMMHRLGSLEGKVILNANEMKDQFINITDRETSKMESRFSGILEASENRIIESAARGSKATESRIMEKTAREFRQVAQHAEEMETRLSGEIEAVAQRAEKMEVRLVGGIEATEREIKAVEARLAGGMKEMEAGMKEMEGRILTQMQAMFAGLRTQLCGATA